MAAELPRPGVEVIQEFRSVSPTITTPTLVPCVVGVGKQIVDLLVPDGSGSSVLNTDSIVALQGFFVAKVATGVPPVYGVGSGGVTDLVFAVNNGPDITVVFEDVSALGLSPAQVVDQINAKLASSQVTSVLAELAGDTQFQLRTVGVGQFQFIDIRATSDSGVLDAFGIGVRQYAGISSYPHRRLTIPQVAFPDPRGNLGELAIEAASIRVYLGLGSGNFQEAQRDQAFLRNGVVADEAVTDEGSVDLTASFPAANTDTLNLRINGTLGQLTLAGPANFAALKIAIEAAFPLVVATQGSGTPNGLILTHVDGGFSNSIEWVATTGSAHAAFGVVGIEATVFTGFSIEVVDDGDGDQLSPIFDFAGTTPQDFTAPPIPVVITGTVNLATTPLPADVVVTIGDGSVAQAISLASGDNDAAVIGKINAALGAAAGGKILASADGGNQLVLTHADSGTDSYIEIVGTAAALAALGLTAGTTRGGSAGFPFSKPEPGDELWIDGAFIGEISEVAPGTIISRLKVAIQNTVTSNAGRSFFIVAKNLPGSALRPVGQLIVDSMGNVTIKQEQLRDVDGNPSTTTAAVMYVTYDAVRLDVTSKASSPGLLRFEDTTQLEAALSPISPANPLAQGLFFALLNAPGVEVTGLGIDAISADSPFGTVEGFTRAAEYLEGFEVYGIAPMTHDDTVNQVFATHVTVMSGPESKGERIVLINAETPTHKLDDLVASGTDGFTTGAGGVTFDTQVANLTALVQAKAIATAGVIPVSEGLFMDIASDGKLYSISGIAGSVVTIRKTFGPGENDDEFYATTDFNDPPLPPAIVDESFSVKIRGGALVIAGTRDLTGTAEAVAGANATYGNRRVWSTFPDQCAATIGGLEQIIEGFFMNAAIAGMVAQNPPQQSFTNFPITGFTQVIGGGDTFSDRQMNIMAGGGTWVIIQEVQGAPLTSRMAVTTDLTSIETRTDSITKVVDYVAKFLRRSLKNFIGRFNITQGFLDSLSSVIQGVLGLLIETGVIIGGNLNNIVQDEDAPDTVLVDITLDVPFPCNYIRLTLVV